ncbi:DUF6499 domain-containing protein [Mesorhizobium sp. B2-3-4]|uniref:transcriptional regulator domain-containing protein n=1 Tax=Mesorhizobium sp. B2-3-4 TaxID=2589959 RepID=UPI0032B23292
MPKRHHPMPGGGLPPIATTRNRFEAGSTRFLRQELWMRPDTSHWRDNASYDYFDILPIEGLAWECLRRHEPYQRHYQALLTARAENAPFLPETQRLWGLRFPGQAGFVRLGAGCSVVA